MENIHDSYSDWKEQICISTWKELYYFIYHKVQNREEAQDITQETYVKAFSYLDKSHVQVLNYNSYLKTIAVNIIRDNWRAKKRKGESINLEEVAVEEIASGDFSDNSNDRTIIKEALQQLTSDQRRVLELRIMQGYSTEETANIMKKKAGSIRVLQYRAIKALTEILKKE